jgi:hypothetical protein
MVLPQQGGNGRAVGEHLYGPPATRGKWEGHKGPPRLRRDWLPPPSSAGLPHSENPGAELPNSKAEAELPHSKPPKQQGGSRASALQSSQTARRKQSFRTPKVAGPRYNFRAVASSFLGQKRTTTKSRSACAGLKASATPKQQGGSRASALQTWLIPGGGLRSRRPCQDGIASGNTRLRPSILTLPPEYLRLSPF